MKYVPIIDLQDGGVDSELEMYIRNNKCNDMVEYLSQWDNGDCDCITDDIGAGTRDRVVTIGQYVLTYNDILIYAGLHRIFEEGKQ